MIRKGYRAPSQLALVLAGFAVVLAAAVASVWLIRQYQDTNDRLTHALTVTNLIATMRADLRRTESGQRGFLLTGKAAYLNDYNTTRGRLLPEVGELVRLAGEQPEAKARAATLRNLVEAKLAELGETIDLELTHRHDDALRLVATDEGLTLTQRIVENLEQILAEESAIVDRARQSADRTDVALFAVNLAGVVLISAMAYGAFLLFQRNARQLQASEREVRALNAELEARVAERTADLEDANAEIQRYAYVVTHDLRSPLVNIMGFTSELEALRDSLFRQPAPAEAQGPPASEEDRRLAELRGDFDEAIHFIKTSIAKMDGLINAILKLSRAGRRELSIRRIDLNDLVEVIAGDFRHRLKESGAELVIGELPTVTSDRMALEQIISNLIDNAVKYLRRDVPGRISISAEETPTNYRISIADNGRGIDPKDRERVFELFRRAGPQDRPGEGIGLAHARGLARRVGGALGVADNPGGGTVFTLTLSKLWMARQSASGKDASAAKGAAA
jgi:signal transduction histidine kinase